MQPVSQPFQPYLSFTFVSLQTHKFYFHLPFPYTHPNRLCTCLLMHFVMCPWQISPVFNSLHSCLFSDILLTFPKADTYALSPACNSEAHPLPQAQSGDIITTILCDLVRGRTFHPHTRATHRMGICGGDRLVDRKINTPGMRGGAYHF